MGDDDDDQFVVADSTPVAPPPEEVFRKSLGGMMDEKPEGMMGNLLERGRGRERGMIIECTATIFGHESCLL